MSMKIGNKAVNKIMIGNKEVQKIVINGNTVYTKPNTDFMVNITNVNVPLSGTTGTSASGGAYLNTAIWDQAWGAGNNGIQAIIDKNYSISGYGDRPYSIHASDAKYFIINKIQLRNATTTARSNARVQIYDSNNNLVYDSITYSKSISLPSNTSTLVTLDLGTSLKLNYSNYRVLVYTRTTTTTYRNAYVSLYDYDIVPGEVS